MQGKAILRIRLGALVDLDLVYQEHDRSILLVVVERGVIQHRFVIALEDDQARQVHAFIGAVTGGPIALGDGDVSPDE